MGSKEKEAMMARSESARQESSFPGKGRETSTRKKRLNKELTGTGN